MLLFGFAIVVAWTACGAPTPEDDGSTNKYPKADGGVVIGPDGEVIIPQGKSQSCTGGTGAGKNCGSDGKQDCCDAKVVPGGTYNRFNDPAFPATVSAFALDTFEVTSGRFRSWVEATNGNLRGSAPPVGGGAHPKIPNSGWRDEWKKFLPTTRAEVDRMLGPEDVKEGAIMACQFGTNIDDLGALTWWTADLDKAVKDRNKGKQNILDENTKEALDKKPLNCVPWHVLFAFCFWDGGRLPTDAEFGFALAGGSEQRPFPWGTVPPGELAHIENRNDLSSVPVYEVGLKFVSARLYDKTLGAHVGGDGYEDRYSFTYGGKAMAKSDNAAHIPPVGKTPAGNGKWGHADLAGSMFEWMLDEGPIRTGQCKDCANVNWPANDAKDPQVTEEAAFKNGSGLDWFKGGARAIRGGAWDNANGLATSQTKAEVAFFTAYPILRTYRSVGGRCAR